MSAPARGQGEDLPEPVHDVDLRALLRDQLADDGRHRGALVVDELGIADGETAARADLAVLGADGFAGFELKGDHDTLARLPRQVQVYSAVFDRAWVVTTPRHLPGLHAKAVLPPWWGVRVAQRDAGGAVAVHVARESGVNPAPSAFARAQLLWREEALAVLKEHDLARGLSKRPRWWLWERLAEHFDADALAPIVLQVLRGRQEWLHDQGRERAGTAAGRVQRAERRQRELERLAKIAARQRALGMATEAAQ